MSRSSTCTVLPPLDRKAASCTPTLCPWLFSHSLPLWTPKRHSCEGHRLDESRERDQPCEISPARSAPLDQPCCSSARTRCSVGGWVLKRLAKPDALNGLMMNMCAVAGLACIGSCFDADSILRSALARPCGPPA